MTKQELATLTGTLAKLTKRFKEDLGAWSTANPPTARSCPEWCETDHGRFQTCTADVGKVQVGPNPDDVVYVRLAAGVDLPASVVVLPARRPFIGSGTLMLQPADALSLAELLDAVGQLDLGDLVREGADVLADRPVMPS